MGFISKNSWLGPKIQKAGKCPVGDAPCWTRQWLGCQNAAVLLQGSVLHSFSRQGDFGVLLSLHGLRAHFGGPGANKPFGAPAASQHSRMAIPATPTAQQAAQGGTPNAPFGFWSAPGMFNTPSASSANGSNNSLMSRFVNALRGASAQQSHNQGLTPKLFGDIGTMGKLLGLL
jgi:hypothetical protein